MLFATLSYFPSIFLEVIVCLVFFQRNGEVCIIYIIIKAINNIVSPYAGKVVWWGDNYTGAYQYTTQHDRSWIHADQTTNWAGVCYLTPNAPHSSGTGLFKHKISGLRAGIFIY